MTELGIYGGTFSPPHNGHIRSARAFARQLSLDRLLIIPTYVPPHKHRSPLNGQDDSLIRYEMLRIAFNTDENDKNGVIELCPYEILQKRTSYTVLTLRHFTAPDTRITFLCGTDMFLTLGNWYMPEEVFKRARIALARRETNPENTKKIAIASDYYRRMYGAELVEIKTIPDQISSTELRNLIAAGEDCSGYMPAQLCEYIEKNGLYKS